MPINLYFSGFESSWPDLLRLKDSTLEHTPKCIMMSFMHMQSKPQAWTQLKEFRSKYKGLVMVDSGAFSFLHNEIVESDKHHASSRDARTSEGAEEWEGKEDEYVQRYVKWAEENRDAYDWLVELDIQKIVGQELVDKWREEWLAKKLPIVIVLHKNAGDTLEVARKWKEKGCEYFGIGSGWHKEDAGDRMFLAELAKLGKVHVFGFTPGDMFNYKAYITSVDSTSWLQAGKQAQLFEAKGRKLGGIGDLRHNPIQLKRVLLTPTMQLWPEEERQRCVRDHKYRILNFYNLIELQKWVDANNAEPGYKQVQALAADGKTPTPEWVGDKDRFGRAKEIYLKSRFNALKSGMYAKTLQQNALECNQCIVGSGNGATPVCPAYEAGAVCAFIPIWRKTGAKTRNQDQIIRKLEEIIAEKYVRYQRASLMESMAGGATDAAVSMFENDLAKLLELLHRVKYGAPGGMKVALAMGKEGMIAGISMNADAVLEDVRKEYGDSLADKIKRRYEDTEAKVIEDGGNGSTGAKEDSVVADAV